jgi:uncharacterized protein (TIGR03437 family)
LNRHNLIRLALPLFALACATAVLAQTPASVQVVSGTGQLICQGCKNSIYGYFQPLVAKVVDANGNPISGASVNWAVTSGGSYGYLSAALQTTQTDGTAYANFFPITYGSGVGGSFNPYAQTVITATSGNATATFYLTQALADTNGNQYLTIQPLTSNLYTPGTSVSGAVGTTGAPYQIGVTSPVGAVPNIALNIFDLNCPSTTACASTGGTLGATLQCAAGANAGAGTVLTDNTGTATCNPIFGGPPGSSGQFYVLAGAALQTNPTVPLSQTGAALAWGPFGVSVSAATPTALNVISGSGQQVQAGTALPQPLVVQVLGAGGVALSGQTINWSVSPSGAATLGSASSTTNTSGQASTTVTLSSSASGTVTITATVAGSTLAGATFTETAIPLVTVTGLSIVSGNNQSIMENAQSAPLTVQLNGTSNGQTVPVPGASIQFSITGPGTLSQALVSTGSNGQASVTVTAGASAGTVTVTASAGGFSQQFTLTVVPPGPQLTASSFQNGADFQVGSISPCSIATIVASGLAPGLQTIVSGNNIVGPLPFSLAGEGVTVNGSQAPIFNVGTNQSGSQQLTFQVPCDATPGSSVPVNVTTVGGGSGSVNVALKAASPGIFQTVMTDNVSRAVIVRPDGSFVSLTNPARKGETVTAFATGFGPSTPSVGTDALPTPGVTATPQYTVVVGMAGQGVPSGTIQLSADLVGVWEVPFTIPASIGSTNYPACGSGNCVTFSISVIPAGSSTPIGSGTTTIPVQ